MKKQIYLHTILTFLLCFLTHFLYEWFPSTFTSLFFPVNESIWEHMKMIYSTFILYGLLEYILLKKTKTSFHNFFLALFIKSSLSIPIYLLLYLPLYFLLGENMIISFILLLLVIYIGHRIGAFIMKRKEMKYDSILGILGIITGFIVMGILTYNPPRNFLFLDTENEKYGRNQFIVH